MAHVISDEEAQWSISRRDSYPWDEWLDGQTRVLARGEDFQVPVRSLQMTVQSAGKRHNLFVRTKMIDEDHLMIKAEPRDASR